MITIGMSHTVTRTVTSDMTARAVGSGALEVLGTPFMLGLMECAAMECVQGELPPERGTVGVEMTSTHVAPTPVGMTIRATAEVTGVSENGKMITFKVTAWDDAGLIGEGTHTRAVIYNQRFLDKCNAKLHG
jgi:predicted thioesterase